MGIGYEDAVIVYNRYTKGVKEEEFFVGHRFDDVRVELTQGANQMKSGMENASKCIVKIPMSEATDSYIPPRQWQALNEEEKLNFFTLDVEAKNFFVVVKKKLLGIDEKLPTGLVESEDYNMGFFNHVKKEYGYAFTVETVDSYSLIPRFEIGGK